MKLVKTSDFGIKGINYYWSRQDKFNLSEEELKSVGVTGNYAWVDERLIPHLKDANEAFKKHGYEIIVKDGYRSPEQYQMVKEKRYALDGKENTDKTFNPVRMPHSTGLTVDINLISLKTGREIEIWDKKDWPDGIFVGFYRNKTDSKSNSYQKLQDLLINTMLDLGFKLGVKNEIWHFEYPLNPK